MKVAAYTGTRNIYSDMVTAAKSLLYHTDIDKVYLLIEDDRLPWDLPDKIECINVSGQTWFRPHGPNWYSGWTWMVLIKAALAKVFPELDRVLLLDSDTIVIDDVSGIWDIDIEDSYFAACFEAEGSRRRNGAYYCNFGVTFQNLKKLRADGKDDAVIHLLNNVYLPFKEQDAFSMLCAGHTTELSSDYNVCPYTAPAKHPKIIHYAARNDWRQEQIVLKYARMPWKEVLHEDLNSSSDI